MIPTATHLRSMITLPRAVGLVGLLGLLLLSFPAAAVTVDDFSTAQAQLSLTDPGDAAGDTDSSTANGAGIVGAERGLELLLIAAAAAEGTTVEVVGGDLVFTVDSGSRGQVEATYDGVGGAPAGALDSTTGLGGVDFTAVGHSGLRLVVNSTSAAGAEIEVEVHSGAMNSSAFALRLPVVGAVTSFICSFSDFIAIGDSGGADFTSVTAVVLRLRSSGVDINVAALETVGPELLQANVLNVDDLDDSDMDGFADPGETVKFTVTLTNTGAEAQSVSLGDVLDQNVEGQTMTLFTTPIAQRDTYQTCGNVTLNINAASGVLSNDSDPDGDSTLPNMADPLITVTATDTSNTLGAASVNADGSFTYTPPAGFRGVDTFGYTVTDDDGRSSTAEVAVLLQGLLWFVDDDDSTGPFTGSQSDPFNDLDQVEAATGPGDIIYIVSDDGVIDRLTQTITLKDNQQLLGGGVALNLCGLSIAAGTAPGIDDSTGMALQGPAPTKATSQSRRSRGADKGITTPPTVTAASGNIIRGLRIVANDNSVLGASGVTDLTVSDVTMERNGFAEGLNFFNTAGTVSVTNLTAQETGVVSTVVNVFDSTADIDFVNSTISPSGGSLFYAEDDASTVDFTGGTLELAAGSGSSAIVLINNTGTYNFSGLGAIVTASTSGIVADNGGTLSVPATASVSSVGGPAFFAQASTFGVDPLVFASLEASSTAVGILMLNIPQGLTVSGEVDVTSSGLGLGVGNSGTVTMTTATNSIVSTGGRALELGTVATDLVFATVSSSGSGAQGISIGNTTGSVIANGGTIVNSSLSGAIDINGGSGTFTYAGSITQNGVGNSVRVNNRSGGTATFSGAIDDNGNGISLTSNTGTTITFSGGLDIDSGTSTGFTATGGGTVNVVGTNTIDVNGAPNALNLNGIGIGASDMTFASISATSVTGRGLSIDGVTNAGSFFGGVVTVNGTGAAQAGISINGSSASFDFTSATLDGTGGAGIFLGGANGTVLFDTVDIDDAGLQGVRIQGNTNTVVLDAGSIGNSMTSGSDGFSVSGGSANITVDASIEQTTVNNSVDVQDRTGGLVLINGAINDTAAGIFLDQNGAGTVTFRGGMTLNTGASTAFTASTSGTINVCDTTLCSGGGAGVLNRIGNTTSLSVRAVDLSDVTLGSEGVNLRSVSVTGASTAAIRLADTAGSGVFRVTGDGGVTFGGNGSGGTIESISNADGIVLDNTAGLVHLQNMIIEDITHPSDAGDAINTRRFADGIHGDNVNGGLTLQSVTLRRFSDHAIFGGDLTDSISDTSWTGLQIHDSLLENANRFHVANRGDDADEGLVRILGLTGTMVVDSSTLRDGARGLEIFTPSGAGTLDVTIQRSTVIDMYKEFNSGPTRNVAGRGFSFTAEGSHDMVVRVGDPAQANPALGNSFTNSGTASVAVLGQDGMTPHTGDIDTVISRNTFIVNDHTTPQEAPGNFLFDFPQGGVALVSSGGTYDGIVSHNLFDEVMHAAGGLGQVTLGLNGGAVQAHVHNNEFRLPWDSAVQIRVEDVSSAAVLFEDNTYTDGMVGSASDDLGGSFPSPFNPILVNVLAGGNLDLTMRREVFPQHDTVNTAADRRRSIEIELQADNPTNAIDLHLVDCKAPEGYRLKEFNGTFEIFQGASASTDPATIIDDNGNTGGSSNDNTDPPEVFLEGGAITSTGVAPTLPSITIP